MHLGEVENRGRVGTESRRGGSDREKKREKEDGDPNWGLHRGSALRRE